MVKATRRELHSRMMKVMLMVTTMVELIGVEMTKYIPLEAMLSNKRALTERSLRYPRNSRWQTYSRLEPNQLLNLILQSNNLSTG
jgi:hypothetical protein